MTHQLRGVAGDEEGAEEEGEEVSATPPVPIISPNEPTSMITGMVRLTAAKPVLPAKLETKKPSTML